MRRFAIGSGHSDANNFMMTSRFPILVFNGGSSSIKFSIYDAGATLSLLYEGEASGIGTPEAKFDFYAIREEERKRKITTSAPEELRSFGDAVRRITAALGQPGVPRPAAIGHRVVHSGPNLTAHMHITPEVLADIEQATSFAPLHEPIALEIIHEAMHHFPDVDSYACFDTVFHQTMPQVASTYPLPKKFFDQGVRRYGFHGLSCESILQQFQDGRVPGLPPSSKIPSRLIIAHLGSGASITAVRDGKSIDTTMGLTPCGGILMATRPGDLDPGLIFYLLRQHATDSTNSIDTIEQLLNKDSGLLALSGLSNDMRVLRTAAGNGNSQAILAIEAFALSVKKSIGSFIALMDGADAVVFTGGIGEHDVLTRSSICAGLDAFGILLDPAKNEATLSEARLISASDSRTSLYVFPSEEDRMISAHVANMLGAQNRCKNR